MTRKTSSAISDELEENSSESQRRQRSVDDSLLDARILELEDEAESPFLRGQRRVPVRRGALPRQTAGKLKKVLVVVVVLAGLALIYVPFRQYALQSWRFRLDSSDNIVLSGNNHVTRAQVLDVMASDIDRNIFFVSLEQRKAQLQQIPWVQTASVLRLLPNRLKIVLAERTPVAFVEMNSHIELIDASGVVMEVPSNQAGKYSFPVIVGMSESDPLSTRAARMKMYMRLVKELDTGGAKYSSDLSDVDLSDPEDVKATVTDPQGAVLVHLGTANFFERFNVYVAHLQEWRTQFAKLESVDLRYEHQVIVNPDSTSAGVTPAQDTVARSTAADEKAPKQHSKTAPANARKHH
jgi:cell division protein FtsQ